MIEVCAVTHVTQDLGRWYVTPGLGRSKRILDLLETLSMSWAKPFEGLLAVLSAL